MTKNEKQQIKQRLAVYCKRYNSQNAAANSINGVSSATISQILNDKWELISDEMWRKVAAGTNYTDEEWIIATDTRDFELLTSTLTYSKEKSKVSFIIGAEGTGKTETINHFVENNKNAFSLKCNDFWNRKTFLKEMLSTMGKETNGYNMYELMDSIISNLKKLHNPIFIFDEADKMSDQLLYFFITLFNNLEGHVSLIMIATRYLQKRIERGIELGKKGYPEVYSRGGKKFIEMNGVGSMDCRRICMANGIIEQSVIKDIWEDSACDIRRIKVKVQAYKEDLK